MTSTPASADPGVRERALVGRVALVTGAASGLGAATAEVLGRAGATVVATDRRTDALAALTSRLEAEALGVEGEELDVASEASATWAMERVLARHQRLDVLVNNAGIDLTVPIEELGVDDFDRIIGVNLRGPFILSRLALRQMRARGEGHIVNVVSTAAKRAWPNAAAYHASKWGLLGLSHALHTEARPHGVKVTAVVAGGMRTPFLLDRFADLDPGLLQDPRNVAQTILHVLAQPPESVIPEVMVLPMRETSWP